MPSTARPTAGIALLLALAALATLPQRAAAADCPGAAIAPADAGTGAAEDAIRCLINRERAARGRRPLRENLRLAVAAGRYAADMVRRGFFSHQSPGGSDPTDRLRRVGYIGRGDAWHIGETLAWGTLGRATPEAIVRAWMASPPHRQVLLAGDFRELGVGAAVGVPFDVGAADRGATYAAELGVRSGS